MDIAIKKIKGAEAIRLSGKDQKVLIFNRDFDWKKIQELEEIVVLPVKLGRYQSQITKAGGLIVSSLGEFEKDEIYVLAERNDGEGAESIDVVEMEIDGVRILYLNSDKEIEKELLNELGVIDVLLIDLPEGLSVKAANSSVQSVDPQVIVPLAKTTRQIEELKEELGVKFEQTKKYKCRPRDFSSEDYVLQGVEIEIN